MSKTRFEFHKGEYDEYTLHFRFGNDWVISFYGCAEDDPKEDFLEVIQSFQPNATNDAFYQRDYDPKYFGHFFTPLESAYGLPFGVSQNYQTAEEMELAIDRLKQYAPSASVRFLKGRSCSSCTGSKTSQSENTSGYRYIEDLTDEEIAVLQEVVKNGTNNDVRRRCECILQSFRGKSILQLSKLHGVSKPTIPYWFDRWEKGGIEGLQPQSPNEKRKRYIKNLTTKQRAALEDGYRNGDDHDFKIRCHCILQSLEGIPVPELGTIYKVANTTILRWLDRWEEKGIEGLKNRRNSKKRYIQNLTTEQRTALENGYKNGGSDDFRMRCQYILQSSGGKSMDELCELYEVSKGALSRWLNRWEAEGIEGLKNR